MALSLAHILRSVAARRPSAEALVHGARRVRYGELWEMTAAIAAHLRRGGLAPGERVALLMDHSVEHVAAWYGVLAAGGVVVGLNCAGRPGELRRLLVHSGAVRLLVSVGHPALAALRGNLPTGCALIEVDEGWRPESAGPVLSSPVAPPPEAPACILYTSGTTGSPKGVTLSHGNLLSSVQAVLAYMQPAEDDRLLHALPLYYSYGNSMLHTHLAAGACLVLEASLMYPHRLLERIAEENISAFAGVPSTFALLMARTRLEHYDLSSLRYVTQAGGPMSAAAISRWREQVPARFFVMYGQTEAGARLSYLPPEKLDEKPGSVGIPIAGTELAILDSDDRSLPPGELGEICARGPHIMLGYWDDPEASAETLRGGWLHTGDLGRMDADGYLYIEGRAGDMIKTGAHRVSPREIEEVAELCEGVAEAAAVGVPDEIMGQLIKLLVVPISGRPLEPRAVLAHCHQHLAAYKVPKLIEIRSELPKTASGKLRRFQLG